MKKISEHISYKEATYSNTATRLNIENIPNESQLANMQAIAENVFEPLREWAASPIKITSFFRSRALNNVFGAKNSAHMDGNAIDFDDTLGKKKNAQMFHYIKDNLEFDTLIWEFGTDKNPDWVHVSYYADRENRGRVLRAIKINNQTHYQPYEKKEV